MSINPTQPSYTLKSGINSLQISNNYEKVTPLRDKIPKDLSNDSPLNNENVPYRLSAISGFNSIWKQLEIAPTKDPENELMQQHAKNLVSQDPSPLKLGKKSELSHFILLEEIFFNSYQTIDFNRLAIGTSLAFCYKAEDPILYLAYNKKNLAQLEQFLKTPNYKFEDFSFFNVTIPSPLDLQHFRNLELQNPPRPLYLGSNIDPQSRGWEPCSYKSFHEILNKARSNFLVCSDRKKYFLLYNDEQIFELSNLPFSSLQFYLADMPSPPNQSKSSIDSEYFLL